MLNENLYIEQVALVSLFSNVRHNLNTLYKFTEKELKKKITSGEKTGHKLYKNK